jgi:hypothetical protein
MIRRGGSPRYARVSRPTFVLLRQTVLPAGETRPYRVANGDIWKSTNREIRSAKTPQAFDPIEGI